MSANYDDRGSVRRAIGWGVVVIFHTGALLVLPLRQQAPAADQNLRLIELVKVKQRVPAPPPAPAPAPARRATGPRLQAQLATRTVTPRPPAQNETLVIEPRDQVPAALSADPLAAEPPPAVGAPYDSPLMHSSRQIARRDDRDSRKGKLAPLGEPYTAFAKMQGGMAGAYRGGPVTMSSYTSPDGVVITRIQRGGTSTCYMSSAVNGIPSAVNRSGDIGAVGNAKTTNCPPADAGWRKQ